MHIDQVRQHSEELFECAVQLRDEVASEANGIIPRFATGDVPVWYISLRLSYFIHKCTEIGAAFHEIYPDSAFNYLSLTLSERILVHPESKFGNKTQWHGQHFTVVLRYVIKISSTNSEEHGRFGDLKKHIEDLRSLSVLLHLKRSTGFWKQESQKALDIILPFITEVSKDLFAVPKWQQDSSTADDLKITASFIRFLVDALSEICKRESDDLILVPAQIDILLKKLQFLVAILGDTPFQCCYSEVEEESNNNNILVKIESFANEAGIFFHSFFFTTDLITVTRMDEELSVLLLKFEEVEAKIKEEVEAKITVLQLENMASSVSIFLVDSVLNDLNHLINHKEADSIVDVKDKMMKLHEDIVDSRSSFLKDRKVQQNNEQFIEYAMKLRDLAYEADYIVSCFVIGEVPVWYLSFRLSNFIQRSQQIKTAFHKIKQVIIGTAAEDSSEVSPQVPRSIPIDDEIFGFEEITTKIEQQLKYGQDCLRVISIIGMPGIGKTTLANRLYNSQSHFDLRLWCVVSQTYRRRQLLIQILSSIPDLNKDEISKMEDCALANLLNQRVKGNRYLLVVDDLWDKEPWDDLRRIFQDEGNGSRIIFTSRSKEVVPSSDEFLHEVPFLSADGCWDLLKKKVFKKGPCPPELEDVGKEIAKKCKGLPLVVVLIAGVLANMPREVIKWQGVPISSSMPNLQEIMELSYKHLPLHLQPCFLYFSRFEEDKEIRVRELLWLWISLGYIEKTEDKNSEDVAEDYLKELINRSMVQVSKRRWDNGIETLNIHDLIRDMCMRIAEEKNFLKVIQGEFSMYEQHHHHICLDRGCLPLNHNSTMDGLHIYSLCCGTVSVRITSSFKLLRVLESLVVPTNFAPELLVKLRYLDIQDFGKNKIWMLENLEFLFVRGDFFEDVALILKNMPKLKHLYLQNGAVLSKDGNISEPNSLETLSYIFILDLNDEECLKHFHHLRHLKCKYGQIDSPNLSCLSLLESLEFGTCAYMLRLQKISFPISIRELSLKFIQLPYEMMSIIGRLPNLEIFKVCRLYVEERSWKTNDDEFKKLKFLQLRDFEVKRWKISRDHFPELERLEVIECYNIRVLPSELGFIPKLRMIELIGYETKRFKYSVMKIQKQQHENGNCELKVIIDFTAYDFDSEEEFGSGSEEELGSSSEEELGPGSDSEEEFGSGSEEELGPGSGSEEEFGSGSEEELGSGSGEEFGPGSEEV